VIIAKAQIVDVTIIKLSDFFLYKLFFVDFKFFKFFITFDQFLLMFY